MLLTDLAQLVVDNSLGVLGTDLFRSRLPEEPDDCVAILEFEGTTPSFVQNTAEVNRENPRAQIQVRSPQYQTARTKADSIWALLAAVSNDVLGSTRYLRVRALNSPFKFDHDANERTVIAFDVLAEKDPG